MARDTPTIRRASKGRMPFLAALLLLAPLFASAQTPPPVRTLKEAYELALKNSDSIAISAEAVAQAEALYRAAFGSSLPELSVRNDTTWQDKRNPGTQSDGALRATWAGLTGYHELAAVAGSKSTIGRRQREKERAEQLLLGTVAQAYYGLVQSRANEATTGRLIEFADKRLAELRERVRVGRAREADALAQEVQSQSLRSQLAESARLSGARADLLEYLVRAPVDPVADEAAVPVPPGPLESYTARAASRPDVEAARDAVRTAEAAVGVARADYLPEFTATGNWYGYRPAFRSNVHWDAAASVSLPLFSFGATRASVAAASAARRSFDYSLRATLRAADLDARNAHRDYSLQTSDEHRGLVTAIEVLQSLDRLNNANLDLASALLQARVTAIALEVAAGAAPEAILK